MLCPRDVLVVLANCGIDMSDILDGMGNGEGGGRRNEYGNGNGKPSRVLLEPIVAYCAANLV